MQASRWHVIVLKRRGLVGLILRTQTSNVAGKISGVGIDK